VRARLPTPQQKVAFLRRPANFVDGSRRVQLVETHFAWVFLGRRDVYKLRKPLRHGGMDYRSLAQRRRGCRAEVVLNRRLAPGIYRGVMPLVMSRSGVLRIGGRGNVVDYLVLMHRLPASRMLDAMLARRSMTSRESEQLLLRLGRFFARVRPRPMAGAAYLGHLRAQMAANRRALRAVRGRSPTLVDRAIALQGLACTRLLPQLAARAACLVDGHGDLRPEHICVGPPVRIIDCIEFDAGLRRMDPLEEMAFLALEIERLDHAEDAWTLLRRYRDQRHRLASDALLQFYLCRRAMVRAQLAGWHIGDPQYPDPRPWLARMHACLRQAVRHARLALAASAG
jgi:aminoglycoside phosphotransferase family enzyme